MPNGGITPDCFHCEFFSGRNIGIEQPHCTHHDIDLPIPIRAFCSKFIDGEPETAIKSRDRDWLDHELDRSQLSNDLIYVWIDKKEGGFFHAPIAPLAEYSQWTYERFLDELGKLAARLRGEVE